MQFLKARGFRFPNVWVSGGGVLYMVSFILGRFTVFKPGLRTITAIPHIAPYLV